MDNTDEVLPLKEFLSGAGLIQYYELFRDLLKVTKVSQLKFVMPDDLTEIGMSNPEQRRYKKLYSKYFPNPCVAKIRKLLSSKKNESNQIANSSLQTDLPNSDYNVKMYSKHIINMEDITLNKELGMGQFGVVQQGTWSTGTQRLQVAIKCLGSERMTSSAGEFLKEASVMHNLYHPNIVRLYGVVLHLDSLMLVTELAPLRSLLECLKDVELRSSFPVPTLCDFAQQICDGMLYLETKRLIHRDLAARNILVFSPDRVKISDFGLSRALGTGKDYYQTSYNVNLKLPVAWCAPECILYLRFTSASDVWAFGVTLWEMFTYGFQPWAAYSGQQILEAIDAPYFRRLERPDCCPDEYYAIMWECWYHNPNDRPKFYTLLSKLKQIKLQQVQASEDFQRHEAGRRGAFLVYKAGQIITVLGKGNRTMSSWWYGVLPDGACGIFDPNKMKPCTKTDPPQQAASQYKSPEDLEQMPLINPNSPSHISSGPPCKTGKDSTKQKTAESSSNKTILSKVKSATLGRCNKSAEPNLPAPSKTDEVHEYQEISDIDTSNKSMANTKSEPLVLPDSSGISGPPPPPVRPFDIENVMRRLYSQREKKPGHHSGTMKPMSAHDEKTLETAVAWANEISDRSMNDLETNKPPNSPSERSKFHFKFPAFPAHQNIEFEKDTNCRQERRNFSEEANRVPDIQATLTEESKMAYVSLIEQRTPVSAIRSQIVKDASSTSQAAAMRTLSRPQPSTPQLVVVERKMLPEAQSLDPNADDDRNNLPLPPRNTKPKLVDMPRHIRKYPLKLPISANEVQKNVYLTLPPPTTESRGAIYQNTLVYPIHHKFPNGHHSQDRVDGFEKKSEAGGVARASRNPFDYLADVADGATLESKQNFKEGALVKDCSDHVSVEDLLEFADQKPRGRERGVESDEVRLMCKVLKKNVTPDICLEALELTEWNIDQAIKIVRIRSDEETSTDQEPTTC